MNNTIQINMNKIMITTRIRAYLSMVAVLLFVALQASAEEHAMASEKKKEVSKTFNVKLSDNLDIDNRYGNITVTHWKRDAIEIRVEIEAHANTERRAQELLDYVHIELEKTANTVYGNTSMKNFKGTRDHERLTINYFISKPSKVKTSLAQRYGNVNLPEHNDAYTNLEVKYGNIKGGDFENTVDVECSYGNVSLGNVETASMELAYCGEVQIKNGKKVDIESRYSNSTVRDIDNLSLEMSYGNLNAGKIVRGSIEARYSNATMKELGKSLSAETAYGTIDIKGVSSSFESVDVEARYGNLIIGMPLDMSFSVVAEQMKYGNYNISSQFKEQTVHEKEDGVSYRSKVNNGNSSRRINFDGNKYGNITVNVK